jgi:hypothetical protein
MQRTRQKDSFGRMWEQANWLERLMMLVAFGMAIWFILVTLFGLAGCAPAPVATASGTPEWEVSHYCTNGLTVVYEYPTIESRAVGHLAFGQTVSLKLYSTNGWREVDYAGGSGYVLRSSVSECSQ